MGKDSLELNLRKATEQFIELQGRSGTFESFSQEEKTILVGGKPVVLSPGAEAPIFTSGGTDLVRVYDARRDGDNRPEFGIGNKTLPILGYVRKEFFYCEWPD